ncbi:NAD-dependent epimerase/dehydratase family protein [Leptospira borgpetersenii serovar Hardjo-bovis]|uniref:NAD-binding protein n=1 Tax=Leptospira borgpetersenii serovar Hardjo-bovis str. Sponselee TaxID=1303729 RepID=M6C249_LEPBO|nr:NAD-dependent epimerase/dehydratase family protein [Leptospira borgpetersenii]ABJ79831.1 Nucleoside-diphosphate-sugar epimerase [Leptospira borgpetersenii serovar Hardjo-bovis str. L550]AMX59229.1 nucleoside-diphosphate sugar epimerase [Leptospira borgpetersenii serovar Hardjo]AMX62458.1 nucleoside-diphosphate sugar epimerase [Leptospira borgpetersenii serovar Hardjo]AMX65700.1 nucleoside-diphosphate sugar epimerase [Leptospira borgpetersenii serovar Hardjo]AMX68933.1 nucleoside-diphosphate
MAKKVLVTGGCGFLGSHVCETFRKQGWDVVSYDSMTKYELKRTGYGTEATREYNWNFLKDLGVTMVKGDIRNLEHLADRTEGCDFIVHTAAQPAMTISWEDPELDFTTNALGTFNVLEVARKRNIPVVNTSSIHVYGNSINDTLKEGATSYERNPAAIGEDQPVMVGEISPLHASKMSAEHYVKTYVDIYKLKAATFRFTGIYGERQFGGEDHGWVANFAIRSVFDWPLRIFGTGKQARDILYAVDGAESYLRWFENPTPGVFNIGGGPEHKISLLECIHLIGDILGKKQEIVFDVERPGDMRYFICDITKAKKFGFNPKFKPREGVERLIHWIQADKSVFEVKK